MYGPNLVVMRFKAESFELLLRDGMLVRVPVGKDFFSQCLGSIPV